MEVLGRLEHVGSVCGGKKSLVRGIYQEIWEYREQTCMVGAFLLLQSRDVSWGDRNQRSVLKGYLGRYIYPTTHYLFPSTHNIFTGIIEPQAKMSKIPVLG